MQKARRRPYKGSDRLQTDGFRFSFTPLFGVLLTFPSRYWSSVGLPGVFSLAGWSPLIRTGFLVSRPTQVADSLTLAARTGVSPASPGLSRPFRFLKSFLMSAPTTPQLPRQPRFGLLPVRSPLLRQSIVFFLFLRVLRCFSSPRSPTLSGVTGLLPAGLPHSDTHGSIPACGSPCIFAACRVLPRLRKPRHPPSALISFSS